MLLQLFKKKTPEVLVPVVVEKTHYEFEDHNFNDYIPSDINFLQRMKEKNIESVHIYTNIYGKTTFGLYGYSFKFNLKKSVNNYTEAWLLINDFLNSSSPFPVLGTTTTVTEQSPFIKYLKSKKVSGLFTVIYNNDFSFKIEYQSYEFATEKYPTISEALQELCSIVNKLSTV